MAKKRATKVSNRTGQTSPADRLLALAMKWQDEIHWTLAYKSADSFRKLRERSITEMATVKRMEDADQHGEMLDLFRHAAERNNELSELAHQRVVAANQELLDIKQLVRELTPNLLEYVPQFNFFDLLAVDVSQQVIGLLKIEGALRAKPPKTPRRSTRRCSNRDAQFAAWRAEGLSAKEIAAKWNRENGDDVSEANVRTILSRSKV